MAWPYSVTKKDLKIEYYRSGGPGGQHKNKTNSACRITHIQTGVTAKADDERCQHKNRRTAFKRLAKKLVPLMKQEINNIDHIDKRSNERVRTYHAVRGTVKDERVPDKIFDYHDTLEGQLDPILEAIAAAKLRELV